VNNGITIVHDEVLGGLSRVDSQPPSQRAVEWVGSAVRHAQTSNRLEGAFPRLAAGRAIEPVGVEEHPLISQDQVSADGALALGPVRSVGLDLSFARIQR
jgi:hypothetical protein